MLKLFIFVQVLSIFYVVVSGNSTYKTHWIQCKHISENTDFRIGHDAFDGTNEFQKVKIIEYWDANYQFDPEKWDEGWRQWVIQSPGLTGEAGTVSIKTACGQYLRHYGSELFLESKENGRNPDIFDQDATFYFRENKFHNGYFSLESVNLPGQFVRHYYYYLRMDLSDGSETFKKDASFKYLSTSEKYTF